MGTAVVFGMGIATLVGIFLIPVCYVFVQGLAEWGTEKAGRCCNPPQLSSLRTDRLFALVWRDIVKIVYWGRAQATLLKISSKPWSQRYAAEETECDSTKRTSATLHLWAKNQNDVNEEQY
jgi:hypothetical protein